MAAWLMLAPALLVLGLRLSGTAVGTPWVQLLALTPLFGFPAALAAACFLASRRAAGAWIAAATAAAFVALVAAPFAPAPAPRPEVLPASEGLSLRMMSLNARLGRADPRAIVDLIRREHVQLLVLQEYTPRLEAGLADAGIGELLPHVLSSPAGGAAGAGIYALFPLDEVSVPELDSMSFENLTASFTAIGPIGQETRISITNVHTYPPLPQAVPSWRRDIATLGRVNAGGGTRILAGDFNATYDHREFRDLLGSTPSAPLVDASARNWARLSPTWPREAPFSPGVVIDHVVTSADVSTCCQLTARVPGTDHAAVLATLHFD
ncbi:endonuclease/exonuclease/phosphatase family protein [Paeniglutamicibacter cryotolerans]|uniref:endonuclease/exonuclease/phosphatase family protein n=1 Tax=Paeniglutamicibacter cryotolerans TaxID=670079 RepID=UPI00161AD257|nr:endonuclease/exonuclease/phosphatase family protein [Paeniglutamicibacter cryotolerans]